MARYEVAMDRVVRQRAVVEVDADSEREAEEKAEQLPDSAVLWDYEETGPNVAQFAEEME